jgi:hypothetical protein
MKKLSVKDLIAFRKKSDRAKQNFAVNMRKEKPEVQTDGGGDYWITCLSAISNSYKLKNVQAVVNKRKELEDKIEIADNTKTKNMYRRNIKILNNYENFDFTTLTPSSDSNFLRKKKDNYILIINGIPIQVKPHHIFSFDNNGVQEVGAIWFIAKLNGFKNEELGMFTNILYKYLMKHFSDQYLINYKYCIAVDVFNNEEVNYLQLENGEIPKLLDSTLNAIKALI